MRFRLEVGKTASPAWLWFLRLAKKHSRYTYRPDGVHVVETNDPEAVLAFWAIIRPRKRIAAFVDGRLVSPARFGAILAQPSRTRAMLDGIIRRKADERERRQRFGFEP